MKKKRKPSNVHDISQIGSFRWQPCDGLEVFVTLKGGQLLRVDTVYALTTTLHDIMSGKVDKHFGEGGK